MIKPGIFEREKPIPSKLRAGVSLIGLSLRFQWTLLLLLIVGALLVLYWLDPARPGIFPPCPFRFVTGLKCPGCGTLRGLHQLLHGHPLAAWRLNPLMVVAIPFMGYVWISYTWRAFTGKPLVNFTLRAFWIWQLLIAILIYWIGRNIF
jgi:hypothetical protein